MRTICKLQFLLVNEIRTEIFTWELNIKIIIFENNELNESDNYKYL